MHNRANWLASGLTKAMMRSVIIAFPYPSLIILCKGMEKINIYVDKKHGLFLFISNNYTIFAKIMCINVLIVIYFIYKLNTYRYDK